MALYTTTLSGSTVTYTVTWRKLTSIWCSTDTLRAVLRRQPDATGTKEQASRVYTLRCTARLPPQRVVLTVTTNKDQLIALIIEDLVSHKADFQKHKLVVTGRDPVPVETANGCVNKHQDMATTQEEGDTLILQQVSRVDDGTVLVVSDDTDIFVLLYFCHQGSLSCKVLMVSPIQG